ncbi:hypothetical protein HGRIS_003761 [Hohenbuehelia grisea]|uniref:Aminoglycoside phosphotransferase domain-containing protein n=1 Tax=Hohenbuehelia grisea TaxID=104357 RepID=A0ABR3JGW5_9AGAR
MIISFWTASGDKGEIEEPDSLFVELWKPGEDLDQAQLRLFMSVENVVRSTISVVKTCLGSNNLVMEMALSDGRDVLVRQYASLPHTPDTHHSRRLHIEVDLLNWLTVNTHIPVPSVLALVEPTEDVPLPYMVMPKLPGRPVFDMLTCMDSEAKVGLLARILSQILLTISKKKLVACYVDFGVELFGLDVPQLIGSTVLDTSGHLQVIPLLGLLPELCSDTVLHSLEDYLEHMCNLKRKCNSFGTTDEEITRGRATIDELEALILRIAQTLVDPGLRRCILSHDDLSEWNVLTDTDGKVTGFLDWEFHSIKPAVLAASYPSWLLYEGPLDPRFAINDGQMETHWLVSPQESQDLIKHFDQLALTKNAEYYKALKQGEFLRTAISWLQSTHLDCGLDRMRAWMAEIATVA